MKKLSIIILSYNVRQLLINCLKSLPGHPDWEVIVVDNASSDDSVAQVKKHFPQVKVIVNKSNLGFAAGNNLGIHHARGRYVLTLNPDTLVPKNTIETVLQYIEQHSRVGAATCRVELPDGSLDYSCHRGFPTPWSALLHFTGFRRLSPYTASRIPNTVHEIDALTGAFALMRRAAGSEAGWFDEDYFWNGEDLDLCYRLKEHGWKIMYIPSVKITHFKGSSAKATLASRQKWALDSTAVMKIFYTKHLASKYPFFVNWFVYAGIWLLEKFRLVKT